MYRHKSPPNSSPRNTSRVTFDEIIREQSNFSSIRREISPNFDANVTILTRLYNSYYQLRIILARRRKGGSEKEFEFSVADGRLRPAQESCAQVVGAAAANDDR